MARSVWVGGTLVGVSFLLAVMLNVRATHDASLSGDVAAEFSRAVLGDESEGKAADTSNATPQPRGDHVRSELPLDSADERSAPDESIAR